MIIDNGDNERKGQMEKKRERQSNQRQCDGDGDGIMRPTKILWVRIILGGGVVNSE